MAMTREEANRFCDNLANELAQAMGTTPENLINGYFIYDKINEERKEKRNAATNFVEIDGEVLSTGFLEEE